MSVRLYVCLYVRFRGKNAIFLAPNWDIAPFFCADSPHKWASIFCKYFVCLSGNATKGFATYGCFHPCFITISVWNTLLLLATHFVCLLTFLLLFWIDLKWTAEFKNNFPTNKNSLSTSFTYPSVCQLVNITYIIRQPASNQVVSGSRLQKKRNLKVICIHSIDFTLRIHA